MKRIILLLLTFVTLSCECFAASSLPPNSIVEAIIKDYKLQAHEEGGYFSEVYTSAPQLGTISDNRPLAGSIYFLLPPQAVSHFHVLDCEEVWYYHAGCGLKIYSINSSGNLETIKLGLNYSKGEKPMVIMPKGTIFAAENLLDIGYTFISCVTVPKFRYEGFRLVPYEEIKKFGVEKRLCIK